MVEQNKIFDPAPESIEFPQAKKQNNGVWKYMAIGCLVIIFLAVIGGFFAYRGLKGFVSKVTEEYTHEKPIALPKVNVSEDEASIILDRVKTFTNDLNQGASNETLILSSKDINVLIANHPDWKKMAGKVYVSIEDDRVKGQISFPLNELGDMFEDRYLNGSAVFRINIASERLLVFLDSAQVGGKPLHSEVMNAIRGENLAKEANNDPEVIAIIEKLESVTIQNGSVIIVPKTFQ